ncbi:hypothetical protein HY636_03235 [Candidatus Woesearchaeota archaeon]|nr:hypothetical protein [Candidatus Woesearchaeota archaeon]
MSNGLSPGFGGLTGIDDARDVQAREQTTLDKLLETENILIHGETQGWYKDVSVEFGRFRGGYTFLYDRLTQLLANVKFTEINLREFILAKANNEYQEDYSAALGLFTGCLLQILSERNTKEGKRTIIYINGQGNRFDYLFSHAKADDTLVVDNFKGDYILHKICNPPDKKAGNIAVLNTSGDRICAGINSNIWNLFIINCCGDYIASEVSERSKNASISNLYILNANGNYIANKLAANGKINDVFIVNENGDVNLGDVSARNGRINTLYVVSISGVINISSDDSLAGIMDMMEKADITKINAQELNMYDNTVHVDKAVLDQYKIRMQETGAEEKIGLLKNLQGKRYEDVIEILQKHF